MNEFTRSIVALAGAPAEDSVHSATIFANELSRDGITVELDGMDFSSYEKNPVVLYAHDFAGRTEAGGLPIGRTLQLLRTPEGRITAEFEFLPGDSFADRVRNAWSQGFLRGASIGWRAIESRPTERGLRVTKSELVEWSIVAVPADPDAVRDAYGSIIRSLIDGPDTPRLRVASAGTSEHLVAEEPCIDLSETREALTRLMEHFGAERKPRATGRPHPT